MHPTQFGDGMMYWHGKNYLLKDADAEGELFDMDLHTIPLPCLFSCQSKSFMQVQASMCLYVWT